MGHPITYFFLFFGTRPVPWQILHGRVPEPEDVFPYFTMVFVLLALLAIYFTPICAIIITDNCNAAVTVCVSVGGFSGDFRPAH